MKRWLAVVGYLGCIPLANWLIGHAGTVCIPQGPCLLPVGFGLMAPSGVLAVGLALCLRDAVQEALGRNGARWAVVGGTLLSAALASPRIAIASGAAFAVSEALDMAVFSRARAWGLAPAVLASGALGLVVDSALFLALAFGSLEHMAGQVVGKAWAVALSAAVTWAMERRKDATLGAHVG